MGQTGTNTGDQLYETNNANSNDFTVTVINPCRDTTAFTIPTLTKDPTVHQLVAREHGGEVILQYEEPTDTASLNYGPNVGINDGYTLCGDRVHYLTYGSTVLGLQSTRQKFIGYEFIEFEYFPDGDPTAEFPDPDAKPVYQVRLNSTEISDHGPHLLQLHFELVDYPDSVANSAVWWVNAQIEYCLVESYVAPADLEVAYTVGHKPMLIEYIFSQAPCSYEATYTARVVEISGVAQRDQTVPSFIAVDSRTGYMAVSTNDLDNLGWYVVEITGSLDVINNLGSATDDTEEDAMFLNEDLYDDTGRKIYHSNNPPDGFIY